MLQASAQAVDFKVGRYFGEGQRFVCRNGKYRIDCERTGSSRIAWGRLAQSALTSSDHVAAGKRARLGCPTSPAEPD
jgi:hypothetical protein